MVGKGVHRRFNCTWTHQHLKLMNRLMFTLLERFMEGELHVLVVKAHWRRQDNAATTQWTGRRVYCLSSGYLQFLAAEIVVCTNPQHLSSSPWRSYRVLSPVMEGIERRLNSGTFVLLWFYKDVQSVKVYRCFLGRETAKDRGGQ